jgi:hypothetical protein
MAGTILKLGYTNPLTDTFGAHPLLGAVIDLNDGATFTLASPDGLELSAPPRSLLLAGNIRTQGEIATRAIVRHNRTVTARLIVGPAASSSALISAIRNLLLWLSAPPSLPITLQYQPFNASTPLYLDVVGASHNLPADEGQWLRGQFEPLTISFITRPGLRDARVTLQNLVANAGFEQPSGAGITAFNDSFATTNGYSSLAGAAPTVASNVMTLTAGARVAFGSPAWGAIQTWQIRFKWVTGLTGDFHLHFVDANNTLVVTCTGTSFNIFHTVGGSGHNLAGAGIALTNGNFYWLQITQFPSAPGEVADVQATLYNDSAGTIGSQVAAVGPVPTFDAVTALSGRPALEAVGASLAVGGNFTNVQAVSLFGPGGWISTTFSGVNSFAWEGQGLSSGSTYPGGPVSSFGAARIDLMPAAASANAGWCLYNGGSLTGSFAIPATTGQTIRASVWVKSSGLGGTPLLP